MLIRLNSYLLTEPVIEKMRVKIQETKEKKLEVGFGLCRLGKSNIIKAGDTCIGTECELTRTKECNIGLYTGGFHTHPTGSTNPSIADLLGAYFDEVECIGSATDDKIKCFVRAGPFIQEENKKIIDLSNKVESDLKANPNSETYQRWVDARNEILSQHFKEIEVV